MKKVILAADGNRARQINSYINALIDWCNFICTTIKQATGETIDTDTLRAFMFMEAIEENELKEVQRICGDFEINEKKVYEPVIRFNLPDEIENKFVGVNTQNNGLLSKANATNEAQKEFFKIKGAIYLKKPKPITFDLSNDIVDFNEFSINEQTGEICVDIEKLAHEYSTIYANEHGIKMLELSKKVIAALQEFCDNAKNPYYAIDVFNITTDCKVKIEDNINMNEL